MDKRPIGIFDSGLGGLTCIGPIAKALPGERILYFGDTARTPYGSTSRETVCEFALQIADFLVKNDVKMLAIACNTISATAHIRLRKNGDLKESVAIGDGPVDASFLAIEQIAGRHYELDDFQIQAVTEGREAMGEAIVKLRAGGKLYSGRGISTDIIGSSIRAYMNPLNKSVYEEQE